jgi:Flp pilus assembly protein TadD
MRNVLNEAQSFLSRAVRLEPKSARANMEYGYFLWQYDNNDSSIADQGFSLIEKSVQLSPKDPATHALLGVACINPYGSRKAHYNPARATTELRTAIALDPHYAYPHWQLVVLDTLLKKYTEAQVQMNNFLSLSPADAANDKFIKILQGAINEGLGKG